MDALVTHTLKNVELTVYTFEGWRLGHKELPMQRLTKDKMQFKSFENTNVSHRNQNRDL